MRDATMKKAQRHDHTPALAHHPAPAALDRAGVIHMITLSSADICNITGKMKAGAQAKVLNDLGIPHKRRRDGTLVVSRLACERALGGLTSQEARKAAEQEPNFGAICGT